ncbi:MAG: PTS sugar transporter subunit IIA [Gammaproteobacteria bacterium]|nr:PTS sugar transporter subunit IIA [Gammaproteobacteria bacterium]
MIQNLNSNISDIITLNNIVYNANLYNKSQVLQFITDLFCRQAPNLNNNTVFSSLLTREHHNTTAIGHGLALPHCRSEYIQQPLACILLLNHSINYNTENNTKNFEPQLVKIVFGIMVPESNHKQHLLFLAQIAKLLSKTEIRKNLESAENAREVYNLISLINRYEDK